MNRTDEGPAPSPRETGPSENSAAARKLNLVPHSTATRDSSASLRPVTSLPLRWARALIEGADSPVIPEYGSPEWVQLPDDSRVKVASTVIAAEKWRTRHYRDEYFLVTAASTRARRIADARRPRPGDHPGGPVRWEPEVASGE